MKRSNWILKILLLSAVFISVKTQAQFIPVGTPLLEDAYRRAQLLGQIDSSISFTARPFFPTNALKLKNSFDPDSSLAKDRCRKFDGIFRFGRNKGFVQLLPITWLQQYNSHHPEGINDGAMVPARGYQTLFSGGLFAKFGPLSIQLRPEIIYAENKEYQGFPKENSDEIWARYYWVLNSIDLPERFGEKPYNKISWGQSSIRLTFWPVSIGFSNENLWWGPGMRNALLMTNSASGFKHLTLNTVKPIRTILGSFEGQIISGRLEPSGYLPPESDRFYWGIRRYDPKPDDWRYFNGMILSYQPRWVPGLFLGVTRSFQVYSKDMGNSFGDYFPIFIPLGLEADGADKEIAKKRDQHASVFMRWLWPKTHGEIYFEYGREDYFWDKRDFKLEAAYSGAYILGLRKLIPLKTRKDEYIQVNMELTQLEMNQITVNRGGKSWYLHDMVRAGYTNEGQLLGAGIGPGSNLQTIHISWVKGLKMFGIQFERYVHNNDFHYTYLNDVRSHWVDLSAALLGEWNYKNLLFNVTLETVKAINYEWMYTPPPPPAYWSSGNDVFNFHGQLCVTYRF